MHQPHIFPDGHALAEAALEQSLEILHRSIDAHDVAVWVLAGGTAPMLAYRLIIEKHLSSINWSKITFLIGDERIGALDGPDNNWHAIEQVFLRHVPQATFMRPLADQTAEQAASNYEKQLAILPQAKPGVPRFDLVWLGMGEDGHTLSLFPGHPDFIPTKRLVIPVHGSPKPPHDRISLTLHALTGAEHTMILASGAGKAPAIKKALQKDSRLPIASAAKTTHAQWFIDKDAAGTSQ